MLLKPPALLLIIAILSLPACGRDDGPSKASAATTQAVKPPVEEVLIPGLIKTEPAELACEGPQVVAVHWDVGTASPATQQVEIWTGPAGIESVFASGGRAGEGVTGPWSLPGTIFTMKDKSTGKVLSRLTIPGPPCR